MGERGMYEDGDMAFMVHDTGAAPDAAAQTILEHKYLHCSNVRFWRGEFHVANTYSLLRDRPLNGGTNFDSASGRTNWKHSKQ